MVRLYDWRQLRCQACGGPTYPDEVRLVREVSERADLSSRHLLGWVSSMPKRTDCMDRQHLEPDVSWHSVRLSVGVDWSDNVPRANPSLVRWTNNDS